MLICILIQVALVVLAILSRIHFSKYKDNQKQNIHTCITMYLYEQLKWTKWMQYYRREIQTIRVLDRQQAEKEVRQNMVRVFGIIVWILLCGSIWTEWMFYYESQDQSDTDVVVERSDYDGEVKTEDIRLTVDDKEYTYFMEIEPREYTRSEFLEQAQRLYENLEQTILGKNSDLNHITSQLELPREDTSGMFSYSWISDKPDIISSYGAVNLEDASETEAVTLRLKITYQTYEVEYEIPVIAVKERRRKDVLERVKEELQQIEKNTRTEQTITLPEQYEDVRIQVQEVQKKQAGTVLFLILMIAGLLVPCIILRTKEEKKKRNNALLDQYPSFVNQLWLLLGTGMTIQIAIQKIMSEMKETLLKRELEYAIHQLENGNEACWVYEQLGQRLHVPEYYQLMQHISQHIRMGTKDLRNLMETEMQTALRKKRESAKKKGEEASTKLLLPMVILLALVMAIIIFPAIIEF